MICIFVASIKGQRAYDKLLTERLKSGDIFP